MDRLGKDLEARAAKKAAAARRAGCYQPGSAEEAAAERERETADLRLLRWVGGWGQAAQAGGGREWERRLYCCCMAVSVLTPPSAVLAGMQLRRATMSWRRRWCLARRVAWPRPVTT